MIAEFTPAMRVLIEDAIEALILLLGAIGYDAELEPIGEREDDPSEDGSADVDGVAEQIRAHDSHQFVA